MFLQQDPRTRLKKNEFLNFIIILKKNSFLFLSQFLLRLSFSEQIVDQRLSKKNVVISYIIMYVV